VGVRMALRGPDKGSGGRATIQLLPANGEPRRTARATGRGKTAIGAAKAYVESWEDPFRKASHPLHDSEYLGERRVPGFSDNGPHSCDVRFLNGRRARQNMQDHLAGRNPDRGHVHSTG
jgi:hypothetical protein